MQRERKGSKTNKGKEELQKHNMKEGMFIITKKLIFLFLFPKLKEGLERRTTEIPSIGTKRILSKQKHRI
jgi:hypothetical protein